MKQTLLVALCIVLQTASFAQDNNRRDGNWWNEQSRFVKVSYALGFMNGMDLGHSFSFWGFVEDKTQSACLSKVDASFETFSRKMTNVSNFQLADGLDAFYKDFRNRSVLSPHAIWIVVNQISGTPQSEIDSVTENWRRSDALIR